MLVWRDKLDNDIFHFGYKILRGTVLMFSCHIDCLSDVLDDDLINELESMQDESREIEIDIQFA